jgi:citrate synthase
MIVVRGYDLCRELIGQVTFTDHAWLLVTGTLPTTAQRRILDAALVAIAEHGLVPSVAASRMTLAAAPEAIQGAVAAGILGCGSVILGSAESAARFISGILSRELSRAINAATHEALTEARNARQAIPGYGHPLHKRADPRVERLLAIAVETGSAGRHVEVARLIEKLLPEVTGKPLVMNVSGAIAAVLLDAGFPLLAVKGIPILARTAGLIAHLLEEQERSIGFILANSGASSISYDGKSPAGFVPSP